MSSLTKLLLERAGEGVLSGLQRRLLRKSPLAAEQFGERLGIRLYGLGKKRRIRAIENLQIAFPELAENDRQRLAKEAFRHFGRAATDFLVGEHRSRAELEETMEVRGVEHLDGGLALGKGVIMVTGHFGCFERAPAWTSLAGYPMSVVIRDADQEGVNRLVNRIRTAPGTRVIPRGNAARPILERLKANEIVGIIPDQNAEDAFLPFFGRPAGTNLGVGVFHERTGAAIVPVSCVHVAPARYQLEFYPALQPAVGNGVKGEGALLSFNSWLEGAIRRHPEQWLWFHDRWRNAREAGLL